MLIANEVTETITRGRPGRRYYTKYSGGSMHRHLLRGAFLVGLFCLGLPSAGYAQECADTTGDIIAGLQAAVPCPENRAGLKRFKKLLSYRMRFVMSGLWAVQRASGVDVGRVDIYSEMMAYRQACIASLPEGTTPPPTGGDSGLPVITPPIR